MCVSCLSQTHTPCSHTFTFQQLQSLPNIPFWFCGWNISLPESDWTWKIKVQRKVGNQKEEEVECFPWWAEMFGTLFYGVQACCTGSGWVDGSGRGVTLRGFRRWRWCPGGPPPGQTAPAGPWWLWRGWGPRTWGPRWSCRLPGRPPAPPPDGLDAPRGRDTWGRQGGERWDREERVRERNSAAVAQAVMTWIGILKVIGSRPWTDQGTAVRKQCPNLGRIKYISRLPPATNTCMGKLQRLHFTVCTCVRVSIRNPQKVLKVLYSIIRNKRKSTKNSEEKKNSWGGILLCQSPPLNCGVGILSLFVRVSGQCCRLLSL